MANRPPYPGTDDNDVRPTGDRSLSTLRWVKVFGIIAAVVILLLVVMLLTGHGLDRHTGSHVVPSGAAEHGVQRP